MSTDSETEVRTTAAGRPASAADVVATLNDATAASRLAGTSADPRAVLAAALVVGGASAAQAAAGGVGAACAVAAVAAAATWRGVVLIREIRTMNRP